MSKKKSVLFTTAAILLSSKATGADPAPAAMGDAPLFAVGVTTSNIEETTRQYQRILGIVPKNLTGPEDIAVTEPDGAKVTLQMRVAFFPNFYVKIQQPVSTNGPYAAHLRRYGRGLQNMQLKVPNAQAVRVDLQNKGGNWTLGLASDPWAYVDLQSKLGTTLEPVNMRASFPVDIAPGATLPLGAMPIDHISVAVANADEAGKTYSDIFGIKRPKLKTSDLKSASGAKNLKPVRLRVAYWKQGGIGIELVQSIGSPSLWSDIVRKQGNSLYSICFTAGDRMPDFLKDLQAKGGTLLYVSDDGTNAFLDFRDTLGLVIELKK